MEVIIMAFKSVQTYNEERYGGLFILPNDQDQADVVFLYEKVDDVLVADVHYIKSADYSGYVHCCGKGCPACSKGIRTQTKLFIPVYNISADEIQFWDRTMIFEAQLQQEVFASYPNPSEYVFRITRHGAARDVNTRYSLMAIAKNTVKPYAQILSEKQAVMPDYYSNICRVVDATTLKAMLASGEQSNAGFSPNDAYTPVPRNTPADVPEITQTPPIEMPTFSVPPEFDSAVLNADLGPTDDGLDDPEF